MTDKTPSQQAKEYARANGFSIEPEGRRYCITRNMSPECLSVVATVGGYPAALNAMQRWIDDRAERQVHCDVVRDDGALGLYADTVVGVNETPARVGGSLDECAASGTPCSYHPHGMGGEMQCKYCGKQKIATQPADDPTWWSTKTAAEIQADIVVGLESLRNMSNDMHTIRMGRGVELDAVGKKMGVRLREPDETDAAYRNLLLYGTSDPFGFVAPLEPIPVASGAHLDELAKIRKPPGGPWHVIFNGDTVMKYGYPTRAEALAVVRWGFNHADPRIRNNWRTGTVTTEFRAS